VTSQDNLFEPDYHLADVAVYTIIMDKLLCVSQGLGLLKYVDPLPSQPQGGSGNEKTSFTLNLPSWVIDWSKTMATIPLYTHSHASLKSAHLMLPGEIDGRLIVQGHQLDTYRTRPAYPATISFSSSLEPSKLESPCACPISPRL
jgi:hypothetical protein